MEEEEEEEEKEEEKEEEEEEIMPLIHFRSVPVGLGVSIVGKNGVLLCQRLLPNCDN